MRLRGSLGFAIVATLVASPVAADPAVPNDPYYTYQAALFVPTSSGDTIADAWGITTDASSVIVAVIDTGVQLDHPDLAPNLWRNDDEIPGNGIDDDGNGYADDRNGYDFRHGDGEPEDEWGHGTLTAGIIGAVGDNGIGTAGVVWSGRLMILKVFGASGGGNIEDFVSAIRYAIGNGARIIHAGWTLPPSYPGDQRPLLMEAIINAREEGILVVAAAGNDSADLDDSPVFPAGYLLDNVLSVAAIEGDGPILLTSSNFGGERVAVATVGDAVLGPYLSGGYATLTGTSSSAALVTGVASLIVSQRPDLSPEEIREIMMTTSTPSEGLDGLVLSGGALNPYASLATALATPSASEGGEEAGRPLTPQAVGGCSLVP